MDFQGKFAGKQREPDEPESASLLLNIPGEIRNRIYDYVVADLCKDPTMGIGFTPALGQVNRKLREEFIPYYYERGVFTVDASNKASLRSFYEWMFNIGDDNVSRITKLKISLLVAPVLRNQPFSAHMVSFKIVCSVYIKLKIVHCHRKRHPSRWPLRQHERVQSILVRAAVHSTVNDLMAPLWKQKDKSITAGDLAERIARLSKWDPSLDPDKGQFIVVQDENHEGLGGIQRRNSMGGVHGRFASLNVTTPTSSTPFVSQPVATNTTVSIQQLPNFQGNGSNSRITARPSAENRLHSSSQTQITQTHVVDESSSTDYSN